MACVFLGVKGVEYYGKYTHGLIPGWVAENETQAVSKASKELNAVARTGMLAAVEGSMDADAFATFMKTKPNMAAMQSKVPAEQDAWAELGTAAMGLKEEVRSGTATIESVEQTLEELEANETYGSAVHAGVFHPHPVTYGNLFASMYFLMTG